MIAARRVQVPLPVLVSQTPLSSGATPATSARLLTVNVGGVGTGINKAGFVDKEAETIFVDLEERTAFFAREDRAIKVVPARNVAPVIKRTRARGRMKPGIFLIVISIGFQFFAGYGSMRKLLHNHRRLSLSPRETQGGSGIVATHNARLLSRII